MDLCNDKKKVFEVHEAQYFLSLPFYMTLFEVSWWKETLLSILCILRICRPTDNHTWLCLTHTQPHGMQLIEIVVIQWFFRGWNNVIGYRQSHGATDYLNWQKEKEALIMKSSTPATQWKHFSLTKLKEQFQRTHLFMIMRANDE